MKIFPWGTQAVSIGSRVKPKNCLNHLMAPFQNPVISRIITCFGGGFQENTTFTFRRPVKAQNGTRPTLGSWIRHLGGLNEVGIDTTCFYLYLFGPTIFWGWVEKNHQLALGRVALRKPTYKAFCTKGDLYGLIMSRIIKAEGFSKWR